MNFKCRASALGKLMTKPKIKIRDIISDNKKLPRGMGKRANLWSKKTDQL
jgi:hypothetical protein